MSLKPICVKCQRFYRCKKTGIIFTEGMPTEPRAPAGAIRPELWKPYKIWSGDLWHCPDCGHQLISGVGAHPIAVQHQERVFKDWNEQSEIQINDC